MFRPRQIEAALARFRRGFANGTASWLAVVAAGGLFVALAWPAMSGRTWVADDLGAFHLPLRLFYSQQLARGEPFDWMPSLYAGFYVTGEGQLGGYHPWHWLLYRSLPVDAAFNLELISSYLFSFVGMFLFLGRLVPRRAAAIFGATLWALGGFQLLHFVHPNAIAVLAHLPWLLWALCQFAAETEHITQRRRRLVAAGIIALLTGSQMLLGYPQYVWFTLVAEGAWIVHLWCTQHPGGWRGAWGLAFSWSAAKVIGLLVGAAQLLPTIEQLAASDRGRADAAFAMTGSLHPANLMQLVAPYLTTTRVAGDNTHEFGAYLGAAPLALVVWLLVCRGTSPRSPDARSGAVSPSGVLVKWVAIFSGLALWLALGQFGLIYRVQTLLPLVGSFRLPCRYLCLAQFGVAILAAVALDRLLGGRRGDDARSESTGAHSPLNSRNGQGGFRPLGWLVALSVICPLVGLVAFRGSLAPAWQMALGPVLIAGAVILVRLAARGSRVALGGLIVGAAVDLGFYGLSYAVYAPSCRLDQYLADGVQPPAPGSIPNDARLAAEIPLPGRKTGRLGNQLAARGARLLGGYAGLEPVNRLDYFQLASLRAAGVGAALRSDESESIEGLAPLDEQWLAVPDPLPRCRLVRKAILTEPGATGPGFNQELSRLDLATQALVDRPTQGHGAPPTGDDDQPLGAVEVVRDRPADLAVAVDCPGARLLVLAERHHPGWRVRIDGEPTELLRVNGDFIGCVVQAGRHEATLRFEPTGLRWGRWISGLGCVWAGLCFLGGFLAPRQGAVRGLSSHPAPATSLPPPGDNPFDSLT